MPMQADFNRLEQRIERLSTLIDVNQLISSSLDLDKIFEFASS
jgi:hypothetical protein